jgi:putative Mn2+ efflux pump MntP
MTTLKLLAIAVALAMDAFAVAIAAGITLKTVNTRQTFRLAWHFGLFQAMMPVIGWFSGIHIQDYIKRFDHWVAFGLLFFVGGKMLWEAFEEDDGEEDQVKDPTKSMNLVVLSVATSIDALAIGFSLSILQVPIAYPALIIGIVAATFTGVGIHAGAKLGSMKRIGRYAEIMGGAVLLAIGFKILEEHDVFSGLATTLFR